MKTSEIRTVLCNALKKVESGKCTSEEAKAVIGLANQVSQSLATEVKVANLKLRLGMQVDSIGNLRVD